MRLAHIGLIVLAEDSDKSFSDLSVAVIALWRQGSKAV